MCIRDSHVVIHDAVCKAVQLVALANEFGSDRFDLRWCQPVCCGFFLDANQLGPQHQGRETDDGHIGSDAVVVVWISLSYRQCFSTTLGATDVIVETRPLAISPFHEHHRGIMSLLHLHVTEVLDRFVAQRPIVTRRTRRGAASRTEAALLVSRIAAIGSKPAL